MVPSSSRTLSLEAWPLWMPAGCAGSHVRPPSFVLRVHSSSRPLHQVVKFTSVSKNFANRRMISPFLFLRNTGSWQQ